MEEVPGFDFESGAEHGRAKTDWIRQSQKRLVTEIEPGLDFVTLATAAPELANCLRRAKSETGPLASSIFDALRLVCLYSAKRTQFI
jgi:hypothetical protein